MQRARHEASRRHLAKALLKRSKPGASRPRDPPRRPTLDLYASTSSHTHTRILIQTVYRHHTPHTRRDMRRDDTRRGTPGTQEHGSNHAPHSATHDDDESPGSPDSHLLRREKKRERDLLLGNTEKRDRAPLLFSRGLRLRRSAVPSRRRSRRRRRRPLLPSPRRRCPARRRRQRRRRRRRRAE